MGMLSNVGESKLPPTFDRTRSRHQFHAQDGKMNPAQVYYSE